MPHASLAALGMGFGQSAWGMGLDGGASQPQVAAFAALLAQQNAALRLTTNPGAMAALQAQLGGGGEMSMGGGMPLGGEMPLGGAPDGPSDAVAVMLGLSNPALAWPGLLLAQPQLTRDFRDYSQLSSSATLVPHPQPPMALAASLPQFMDSLPYARSAYLAASLGDNPTLFRPTPSVATAATWSMVRSASVPNLGTLALRERSSDGYEEPTAADAGGAAPGAGTEARYKDGSIGAAPLA